MDVVVWAEDTQATSFCSTKRSLASMIESGNASSNDLWRSIRREAETAAAIDPVFGSSLAAAVLDQADLGSAVAHQIGERLGNSSAERKQLAQLSREAFL